jgi:predicted Zn-dependent protease
VQVGWLSKRLKRAKKFYFGLVVVASLFFLIWNPLSVTAENPSSLPPLKVHSLPPSLAKISPDLKAGNYFDQIESTPLGYLIWSEFPIKVYLDRPPDTNDSSASYQRFQQWTEAVLQAIADWNVYLPLIEVKDPQQADIVIQRTEPPLGRKIDPDTGQIQIPRARTAQTRYQFYSTETEPPLLSTQMTIQIKPGLSPTATLAAIRHELGHALGIWGHSPIEEDVLFYSQTQKSPPISTRDVNTLIKIYQQPTRLGWPLPKS